MLNLDIYLDRVVRTWQITMGTAFQNAKQYCYMGLQVRRSWQHNELVILICSFSLILLELSFLISILSSQLGKLIETSFFQEKSVDFKIPAGMYSLFNCPYFISFHCQVVTNAFGIWLMILAWQFGPLTKAKLPCRASPLGLLFTDTWMTSTPLLMCWRYQLYLIWLCLCFSFSINILQKGQSQSRCGAIKNSHRGTPQIKTEEGS